MNVYSIIVITFLLCMTCNIKIAKTISQMYNVSQHYMNVIETKKNSINIGREMR